MKNKLKVTRDDKIFYGICYAITGLLLVVILYPLIFVVSSSFSSGVAISSGQVILWPVEFSTSGYEFIFQYRQVWTGYRNTIVITVVATVLNLFLTICAAYPLSRRDFTARKYYIYLFLIPMFLSGGIIPTYILMAKLNLTNTLWAVILSGAVGITNVIIMRTYFQNSIPYELFEAARLDGISDLGYLLKIALPLSKPVLAVITLYYAMGHWNSYFNAMMYLRDPNLYPLQVVLRDILSASNVDTTQIDDAEMLAKMQDYMNQLKYALVVVSSLPLLVVFPFVQKFFEKGVMIGSVKG